MKKTLAGIDIAKLFFAFCIVMLHSGALGVLPNVCSFAIEKAIFRLAVPFFFVVSGYFLGKKLKTESPGRVIRGYVKRLLVPFIFWGVINTVLEIIKMVMNGSEKIELYVIQHILFYPYGALWYVYASIVGAILLLPFLKKKRINLAIALGVALYMFALLCNNYYFVAESIGMKVLVDNYMNVFISARNGLFVGFLLLGIGIKLSSDEKNNIVNAERLSLGGGISWYRLLLLGIAYLLEILLNVWMSKHNYADDGALYLTHLILIPYLVLLLTKVNISLPTEKSKLIRNLSTGIYFQHRMWLSVISMLGIANNGVMSAILTITFSVIICLIVYMTKNKFLMKLVS